MNAVEYNKTLRKERENEIVQTLGNELDDRLFIKKNSIKEPHLIV